MAVSDDEGIPGAGAAGTEDMLGIAGDADAPDDDECLSCAAADNGDVHSVADDADAPGVNAADDELVSDEDECLPRAATDSAEMPGPVCAAEIAAAPVVADVCSDAVAGVFFFAIAAGDLVFNEIGRAGGGAGVVASDAAAAAGAEMGALSCRAANATWWSGWRKQTPPQRHEKESSSASTHRYRLVHRRPLPTASRHSRVSTRRQ